MRSVIFPRKGNIPYRVLCFIYSRKIRSFERAARNPITAQEKVFRALIKQGKNTDFGRKYQFSTIRTLEEYRKRVPVHHYDDFKPFVDRIVEGENKVLFSEKVTGFVETSGTSARAKLIPVTSSWAAHIQTAQILWIISLLKDFPQIAKGKTLRLLSSAQERKTENGLSIGANTGRMQDALPKWLQGEPVFPAEISAISDQEIKIYVRLRFALQEPISSWTTANPSTILLYCRKLQEYKEALGDDLVQGTLENGPAQKLSPEIRAKLQPYLRQRPRPIDWHPAALWPLRVINCWKGGPAHFFVQQLPDALGGDIPIRDVGITASEGYFALPLSNNWNGGVLWTEGELLEFRDEEGMMHWAWELEIGKQYQLVISTLMGLYRYDLRDIIEVTGFYQKTPIIRFVGKAGRFLNATGEKVSEEQFSQALQNTGAVIIGATAKTVWQEVPYIKVGIEAEDLPSDFEMMLERCLQEVNIEYAQKRKTGRLQPLQLVYFSEGTYQRYRKYRIGQGASSAQVKDLLIAVREEEWADLLSCSQVSA